MTCEGQLDVDVKKRQDADQDELEKCTNTPPIVKEIANAQNIFMTKMTKAFKTKK